MGPPVLTTSTADDVNVPTASSMEERWEAFQRLAQASEGAFRSMSEALSKRAADTAMQQKELAAYQESQNALAMQQQHRLDALTRECAQLRQSDASAREVVAHQAERLVALESELQSTRVRVAQTALAQTQLAEQRDRLQQTCKNHEMHTGELQASLRFADEVVRSMRETVAHCEREKNDALREQYGRFERYRTDLTTFYDKRAVETKDEFVAKVQALQETMATATAAREVGLKQSWQDTAAKLRHEYEEVIRLAQQRRATAETECRERKEQLDRDREAMRTQMREEAQATELRFRDREEALLEDIARRERELRDREAGLRAAQAQQEQETQRKWLARETELRTAHDTAMTRATEQFAAEREKLSDGFMERLQQLSNAHMQQERELERMHREKEREMAQRYRLSTVDGTDRKGSAGTAGDFGTSGSDAAKEALLRRFESVEQRQRERSDKLRSALSSQGEEPAHKLA